MVIFDELLEAECGLAQEGETPVLGEDSAPRSEVDTSDVLRDVRDKLGTLCYRGPMLHGKWCSVI